VVTLSKTSFKSVARDSAVDAKKYLGLLGVIDFFGKN